VKPVKVIWKDAHADAYGWTDLADLERDHEPYVVESVGLLLSPGKGQKRKHVSIAQSLTIDGHVDSVLHIPKRMVLEVVNLTPEAAMSKHLTKAEMRSMLDFLRKVTPRGHAEETELWELIVRLDEILFPGKRPTTTNGSGSVTIDPNGTKDQTR
jgi:hypothetical protein